MKTEKIDLLDDKDALDMLGVLFRHHREFTIYLKFYDFKLGNNASSPPSTIIFDFVRNFIKDNEFLSANYAEIWSMNRDLNDGSYDVKMFLKCCPNSFEEWFGDSYIATVSHPFYGREMTASVEFNTFGRLNENRPYLQ